MTTNKTEVVAYLHTNKENPENKGVSLHYDASCTSTLVSTEPLIRLSDYENLQSEMATVKKVAYGNLVLMGQVVDLQAECDALAEALEEISDPIRFMKERLEEGERLNGMAAVELANDASYLKDIATAALATQRKGDTQ